MRWHQPRPPRTSPSEASRKSAGCPLDFTTGFFVRAEGGKLPCVRHWKWHRMHSSFGIRCPGSRAIRFRIRRLYDFERALFSTVFDLPVPSSRRSCQVQWRRHRQPMMSARGAGLVCGGPRRLLDSPQDGTDVRLNVGSWCRFPETGLFPSEDARLVRCGPEAVGLSRLGVGVDRMGSWHRRTALIGKEHSE